MTTRKDMKRKLKASAKRRSRRLAATDPCRLAESGAELSPAERPVDSRRSVDIGSAIAQVILDFAAGQTNLRDNVVLSALRSCYHGTIPSGDDSVLLAEKLSEIPKRHDIRPQAFRRELDEMLTLARGQRGSGQANPFLQLLQMLAR